MQPRVTIGVPVYNGEALLPDCLRCLASQTSAEFLVLIMDNASTDGTPVICREFAERDRRFRVLRQPKTVDARQNFADVLDAADTDFFAWRAHDDLSSVDWIEKLTAVLDSNARADLAAGRVLGLDKEGRQTEERDAPPTITGAPLRELRGLATAMSPSWMYGLYRREKIRRAFARCRAAYPYVWSLDVLVLLYFIVNRALAGTNAVTFQYRATGQSGSYLRPNHYRDSWAMWRNFHRAALTITRESSLTAQEKRALYWTLLHLTNQRSERPRRLLRGALGAWFLRTDGRVRKGPLVRLAASQ
jgi:glycosyltransferase involved in cell wall biosynthesis